MKLLNCGVVGLGEQSSNNLIPALLAIPTIKLKAVCDLDEERVQSFTRRFDINGYENWHEMLETQRLDFVVAACPPQVHYEIALECLKRGIHVFVEKPPCSQTNELKNLITESANCPDLVTGVGLNFNFSQSVSTIKSLIWKAGGAKQIAIEYAATKPRESLWGFSIARSFILSQAIHALGIAFELNSGHACMRTSFEVTVEGVYIFAHITMKFDNGNLVTLTTGNGFPFFEIRIKALCNELVIELDNLNKIDLKDANKLYRFGLQKRWSETWSGSPVGASSMVSGYQPELQEFVDCIFEKRKYSADFSSLLPNYEIMDRLEMEIESSTNTKGEASLEISDKYQPPRDNALEEVRKALFHFQGSLSGTSATVSSYAAALADYFDTKHALPVSSGGAALTVAFHGAGLESGDEVILAPTCPLCTVYPLIDAGLIPVFCDSNEDNFGPALESLEELLTPKTKAIVDVPMWGYPTPTKALFHFANTRGLILIRDAAQAHGTMADGSTVAKYCHVACFSTHDRKMIATGEGGFILTDSDNFARRMKSFIQFGYLSGEDLGMNFKLNGVTAALGISSLAQLDNQLSSRQKNAGSIISRLRTDGLVREFSILPGGQPNYYTLLLAISADEEGCASSFIRYLNERGVPSDITRYKCKPVFEFPRLQTYSRPCPNATSLIRRITTIPVHPGITQSNLNQIVTAINSYPGI